MEYSSSTSPMASQGCPSCYAQSQEILRLQEQLRVAREALRANLRDFETVNNSSMWRGHPFTHAVRDIKQALAAIENVQIKDTEKEK